MWLGKSRAKSLQTGVTKEVVQFGALHPANEGFLTGRGTDNAIHTVLNLWENARNNNKACYNIMYDVSGA